MDMSTARIGFAVLALALSACSGGLDPSAAGELERGSWGRENAGGVGDDSIGHGHVGCTYGNFRLPFAVGRSGRGDGAGEYLLRGYPVAGGPTMPATLRGALEGERL